MPQTFEITAPNGKTLEITGDRMPTESDLHDIFKAAGIETGVAKAAENPRDPRTFGKRVADAAVEIPLGMAKQAGRYVQAIPGVAAATDKLYGLPAGASKQAMQPANANEEAGGYLGDLALMAATAGAEAGPALLSKTAGYVSNPTVGARAIAKLGDAARFTGDVASIVKANISTGGPLTATKVADLITRYGKDAVRLGIKGTLGIGAYEAFKHLF